MKRNELKALSEKYNMEIMRHPITDEAWGLRLETSLDIPELDALCGPVQSNVGVTKEYGAYQAANGTHLYTVYCPTSWFNLYGWV